MKLLCLLLTVSLAALAGPITLTVYPSLGPYRDLSPSYSGYTANALTSIEAGLGQNVGGSIVTNPAAYNVTPAIPTSWMFYTGWPSWLGVADPPPPFDGEVGNHVYFSLRVLGNGSSFSLSNLSYVQSSSDPYNYFWDAYSYASDAYRADRVGIYYGPDGIKGTADDVIYNAGQAGALLINELLYLGVGVSFDASGYSGATHQDALNAAILDAWTLGNFTISTCYAVTLGEQEGYRSCGHIDVETPEPATFALLGAALTLLGLKFRRRKA